MVAEMEDHIEALEAKCALLSASLRQVDKLSDERHEELRVSEAKRQVAAMRLREVLTRDGLTLLCREALRDAISDVER